MLKPPHKITEPCRLREKPIVLQHTSTANEREPNVCCHQEYDPILAYLSHSGPCSDHALQSIDDNLLDSRHRRHPADPPGTMPSSVMFLCK